MTLSPTRTAGVRPAKNVSNDRPDDGKRNTPGSQHVPQEKQLGFPLPSSQSGASLVQVTAPLSASSAGITAAPLTAAVDRLLKQPGKNNLQGFVVFDNFELALVQEQPLPGHGLSEPGQRKALSELLYAELAHRAPDTFSQVEREEFETNARVMAASLVSRTLLQPTQLQLRGLMGLLRELRAIFELPASAARGPQVPESKTSAQPVQLPLSPGPLRSAIDALQPDSKNKQHYIVFKNNRLTLVPTKPAGLGLAKGDQHKAFCDLVFAEFAHMTPEGVTKVEREAFEAIARETATGLVNRNLEKFKNHSPLSGLMEVLAMVPELHKTYVMSRSGLETRIAPLDVQEVSQARGAQAGLESTGVDVTNLMYALRSGILVQFGLWHVHTAPRERMLEFTPKDMDHVIAGATACDSANLARHSLAHMFDAIHGNPALSECTLNHANRIRQSLAVGDVHTDRVAGAGPAAASLLLSLPPQRLKRMFLSRKQVHRLAEEAVVLLGHMGHVMKDVRARTVSPDFAEKLFSHQEAPGTMYELANEFMDSPGGMLIASRFKAAIEILLHNAERLEAFAELDDASDDQLDEQPTSINDLLDEYVPADFQNARRIDLHALPGTGQLSLTLAEDSPAPVPEDPDAAVPPVVFHAAQAQPEGKFAGDSQRSTRDDTSAARPARAAASTRSTQPEPAAGTRADAAFPGAKRRNPAEHFHPREHRALSRDQLRQRQDVLAARELNLIGDYDKWTPELRSLLQERSRARRAAQQGTTNISAGGRLVPPANLDRA